MDWNFLTGIGTAFIGLVILITALIRRGRVSHQTRMIASIAGATLVCLSGNAWIWSATQGNELKVPFDAHYIAGGNLNLIAACLAYLAAVIFVSINVTAIASN